jgi:DNA-binding MarR family transcriptional regulator
LGEAVRTLYARGISDNVPVNLRFLEAFHCIATLGSVSEAAARLHLTQSAVSSRLAALEQ